jgi:hypothetical protein
MGATLRVNRSHPFFLNRPRASAALTTNDYPRNAAKVHLAQILKERFDGQESDIGWCCAEVLDARQPMSAVLHAHAPPNM